MCAPLQHTSQGHETVGGPHQHQAYTQATKPSGVPKDTQHHTLTPRNRRGSPPAPCHHPSMFHDPRPPYVLVLLSVSSRVCALGGVGWSLMGDILSVGRVLLGAVLLGLLVVAGGRVSCRRAAPADTAPLLVLAGWRS